MNGSETISTALVRLGQPGDDAARIITTIDHTQPAGRVKIFNAIQGQDWQLDVALGKTLAVADVVQHQVPLVDPESGEVTLARRTVLITVSGERFGCVSQGIDRAVRDLVAMNGPPSAEAPYRVIPTEIRTRLGRKYLTLTLTAE